MGAEINARKVIAVPVPLGTLLGKVELPDSPLEVGHMTQILVRVFPRPSFVKLDE